MCTAAASAARQREDEKKKKRKRAKRGKKKKKGEVQRKKEREPANGRRKERGEKGDIQDENGLEREGKLLSHLWHTLTHNSRTARDIATHTRSLARNSTR